MKKRLVLDNKKKRIARRRYVLKAEKAILENKEILFPLAEKMQSRGWYSDKTSLSDIVFSIFGYMEGHAKRRGRGQEFKRMALEKGLFLFWRKRHLQHSL